jgi:hypothetical protein
MGRRADKPGTPTGFRAVTLEALGAAHMSISCLQQERLPALPISPAPMPDEPFVTLTEIVSKALYGAPLTPGTNGTLRKAMHAVSIAQLIWHNVQYPPEGAVQYPRVETSWLTAEFEAFPSPIPLPPDAIVKRMEELVKNPPDWLQGFARQSPQRFLEHRILYC